jgi:hypothetical protein
MWTVAALCWAGSGSHRVSGQELEPGAYAPSPKDFNILIGALTFNSGDLAFDPAGPIDNASADIGIGSVGYVRTLGLWGRLANVGFGLPYVRGSLEGDYLGEYQKVFRSGQGDPRLRFAINLHGGPALALKEFMAFKRKWNLGVSLTVGVPLGQYDSSKLINIGSNRWSFKPEVGISRTFRRWRFEGAVGAWFFTDNDDFFGGATRKQEAIGSFQFHAIYTIRPRIWIAYDANYYTGGRTSFGAGKNEDLQSNSRMGLTFAMPVNRTNSFKVSYSRGAYTTVGAKFDSIGVAWQVIWGPTE